jgi:hypothetical protein
MDNKRHYNQVVLNFSLKSKESVKNLLSVFEPTLYEIGLRFNACYDVYFLRCLEEQIYFVSFLLFVVDEGFSDRAYTSLLDYLNQEKDDTLFQKKLEELGCLSFSIESLLPRGSILIKRNYKNYNYSVFTIKIKKDLTWFQLFFILSYSLHFNKIVFSEENNSLVNSSPVFGCCINANLVLYVAEKSTDVLAKQVLYYLKKRPELYDDFKKQRFLKKL